MPDTIVYFENNSTRVVIEGAELLAPLIAQASGYASTAQAQAAFVQAQVDSLTATLNITPIIAFAGGIEGFYLPVDPAYLYSDRAGTIPAVVDGPVGYRVDRSGRGRHAIAPTDAARPTLRVTKAPERYPGLYYLEYDGVDDRFATAAFVRHDVNGKWTAIAAVEPYDTLTQQVVVDSTPTTSTLREVWLGINKGQVEAFGYNVTGTLSIDRGAQSITLREGEPVVLSAINNGSSIQGFTNGVGQAATVILGGAGTSSAQIVGVGGRVTGVNLFKGREFGSLLIAREITAAEHSSIVKFMMSKSGAELPTRAAYFAASGVTQPRIQLATFPSDIYIAPLDQTWSASEMWNWRRQRREFWVSVYDHRTHEFTGDYFVGIDNLENDDHGAPALVVDHQNHVHVFGGAHIDALQHFTTVRPGDPASWFANPNIGASLTYPHPFMIGSTLYMIARYTDSPGNRMTLRVYTASGLANGKVTGWSAGTTILDFENDTRVYAYRHEVRDGKVHIIATRATYLDTQRLGVYYVIYDPATGNKQNLAGTRTTAGTIDLAEANTYYRLVADGAALTFMSMDFCWDAAATDKMHLVYIVADKWYWRPYVAGVAGTAVEIAPVAHEEFQVKSQAIVPRSAGGAEFWYTEDAANLWPYNGNIWRRLIDASGRFSPPELIRTAARVALGNLMPVYNGRPEFNITYTETAPDPLSEDGALRVFAHGSNGPVRRKLEGPRRAVLARNKNNEPEPIAITTAMPIGASVALVDIEAPANPISIRNIGSQHPLFTVDNGYLKVAATPTIGGKNVILRATDFQGTQNDVPLLLNVSSNPAYTFTNAEASSFVTRTGTYWNVDQMAAIDSFVTAWKACGAWAITDVLNPPGMWTAHAATRNLKADVYNASMVHGSMPVTFLPKEGWLTPVNSISYMDTGFNPTTGTPFFSQNSACIGVGSIGGQINNIIGWYDGTDGTVLLVDSANLQFKFFINQAAQSATAVSSLPSTNPAIGLFTANRSGAAAVEAYRDGVALTVTTNPTQASVALNNANFNIGRYRSDLGTTGYVAYAWDGHFIMGSANSTMQAAMATAWNNLKSALSAAAFA